MGPRAAALIFAGCGRIAFEPRVDDAAPVSSSLVRFAMDDAPDGMLRATPDSYSVACAPCPAVRADRIVGAGAYQFDGTQHIELGALAVAPTTVTLWIAPDASLIFGSALSRPLDLTTVRNDLSLAISNTWTFEGTQDDMTLAVVDNFDLRGSWHHLALVDDGSTRSIYRDGAFVTSVPGPWQTSQLPLSVGADLDNGVVAIPFTGGMDDLRFYDHVLSAGEIAAVFAER